MKFWDRQLHALCFSSSSSFWLLPFEVSTPDHLPLSLSQVSSSVIPTLCMSSFITSINCLCGFFFSFCLAMSSSIYNCQIVKVIKSCLQCFMTEATSQKHVSKAIKFFFMYCFLPSSPCILLVHVHNLLSLHSYPQFTKKMCLALKTAFLKSS